MMVTGMASRAANPNDSDRAPTVDTAKEIDQVSSSRASEREQWQEHDGCQGDMDWPRGHCVCCLLYTSDAADE